jgi:hypothetical protein
VVAKGGAEADAVFPEPSLDDLSKSEWDIVLQDFCVSGKVS